MGDCDQEVLTEQTVSTTNQVRTFVVFDTETTGLPSVGNNPKITELCFIALTRDELITKQSSPRVLNKLLICFNPGKRINHGSSQISALNFSPREKALANLFGDTNISLLQQCEICLILSGLHNDALEAFALFKKQAPVVCTFLKNLPLPACLIAHNGNGFDFPLLVSELKNANEEIPDGILCADSLEAFRMFDGLPPVPEFVLQKKQALARVGGAALADAVHESANPIPRNLVDGVAGGATELIGHAELVHKDCSTNHFKTANMGTHGLKRTSDCADLTVEAISKQHKACLELGNEWENVENTPTKPAEEKAVSSRPSPPPLQRQNVQKKRTEVEIQRNIMETRRQLFDDNSDVQPHGGTKCSGSSAYDAGMPASLTAVSANILSDNERDQQDGINSTESMHKYKATEKGGDENCGVLVSEAQKPESLTDSERELLLAVTQAEMVVSTQTVNDQSFANTDSGVMTTVNANPSETTSKDSSTLNGAKIISGMNSNNLNSKDNLGKGNNGKPNSEKKEDVYTKVVKAHKEVKVSYSLTNLYAWVFGQQPEIAHTAEDDCLTLLKLIRNKLDIFPEWCDKHAVSLKNIEPMY